MRTRVQYCRPNLFLDVRRKGVCVADDFTALLTVDPDAPAGQRRIRDGAAIVYCPKRATAEGLPVAAALRSITVISSDSSCRA